MASDNSDPKIDGGFYEEYYKSSILVGKKEFEIKFMDNNVCITRNKLV